MKRSILTVCLFLFLGAFVNVAVAWTCVTLATPTSFEFDDFRAYRSSLSFSHNVNVPEPDLERFGWKPRRQLAGHRMGLSMTHRTTFGHQSESVSEVLQLPADIGLICGTGLPDPALISIKVVSGFPTYALRGECWADYRPTARPCRGPFPELSAGSFVYLAAIPRQRRVAIDGLTLPFADALPLRPIWPGFAINTVFYAVGGWLLFAGPFVVRRWRRIRRGLCPKCAYDLRGTTGATCPECGARIAPSPRPSPSPMR